MRYRKLRPAVCAIFIGIFSGNYAFCTNEQFQFDSIDTQVMDVELPYDLIADLNNQEMIQKESQYEKLTEVSDTFVMSNLPPESITYRILEFMFENHPELKGKLLISTFRITKLGARGDFGLNGESRWHRDNILFPQSKNMNLIFSWGPGTESMTRIANDDATQQYEEHREVASHNLSLFDRHLVSRYAESHPDQILSSQNGRLLATNGTEVYHRRADVRGFENTWRYFLNMYYQTADF